MGGPAVSWNKIRPGGDTSNGNTTSVLGTDQLTKALSSFDGTVTKLEAAIEKLSSLSDKSAGPHGGFDGGNAGGARISGQQTSDGTGYVSGLAARFGSTKGGQFAQAMGAGATSTQAAFGKQGARHQGGNGEGVAASNQAQFSGGQQQNGGGASFGGRGGFLAGMAAKGGTAAGTTGGALGTPSPGGAAIGLGSSVAGAVMNPSLNPLQTAGTIAGATIGAVASFGAASLPTQVDISSYTRSQSLFGISNFTARNRAYGANGNNINMLGQNAADASAGQSTINSLGNYGNGARYQTANAGAAGIGIANPGQSYAQDANFMAIMTDPQMSRQLNMSGIQNTMLTRGGGTNSLATMQSSIMKRLTGSSSMSQSAFNAKIGGLNTSGNKYLQQQFGGDIAAQMTSSFALQNRLEQGMNAQGKSGANAKMSDAQVSSLLQNASKGKQGALDTLGKYGAPESDIQALQKKNAVSTATQGDISQNFTAGLTAATTALGGFDKAVEKIINLPGIKQLAGGGGGFLGTVKSFTGLFAAGGVLPGYAPGKDTVPAMLSPGEGVLTPEATKAVGGKPTIDALNKKHAGTRISQERGSFGPYGFADGGVTEYDHLTHKGKHKKKHKHHAITNPSHDGHATADGLPGKYADGGLVQYFGGGGYANPLRDVKGITPERIDQGVDYSGKGPIHPIAAGTVKSTTSSGWAFCGGDAWIVVDHAGGRSSYYAEGITPKSKVGDHVTTSTAIGEMTGCVEFGWADPNGAQALAHSQFDGSSPTAYGQDFSNLIKAAGGPAGTIAAGLHVKGSLPKGWAAATGSGSGGTSTSTSKSKTTSTSASASGGGGGGGASSGISEAANVASALGGGGGGGGGASAPSSGTSKATSTGGSTGGTAGPVGKVGAGAAAFVNAVLKGIGAPVNAQTTGAMLAWGKAEGGGYGTENQAHYNPWNLNPPGGTGWPGNAVSGAWSFPSAADGATYTAKTLEQGNFSSITGALKKGKSEHDILEAIVKAPWAGSHYGIPGVPGESGQTNIEMSTALKNTAGGGTWYASGTKSSKAGAAIVGERGPELLNLPAGSTIADAKTTAMIQAQKGTSQRFQPPPTPSQAVNSGGGQTFNLEFKAGSIVIGGNGTGGGTSKTDASHSAREFITELEKQLKSEDMYAAIAQGNHHA